MRGKKNKPTFSISEEPKKLDLETHKRVLMFLSGLMYVVGDKLSLDDSLALHTLIGTKLYDTDGAPFYIDDCFVLETLREMSARGLANFKKKGRTQCVRTTNSTKRKAVKRKNV